MMSVQHRFENKLNELRTLQKEHNHLASMRMQSDAQLNENKMVQNELSRLSGTDVVYKLIGPVLMKQDLEDAKMNIDKRLEYISADLKRQEKSISDCEKKQDECRTVIQAIQLEHTKTQENVES